MSIAAVFRLDGFFDARPARNSPSGESPIPTPIRESVNLCKKHYDEIELTADTPVAVSFGGLPQAEVVVIKVPGKKVTARLTSADGATQSVPIEELFIDISLSTPFTAIDLTRVTGVTTTAKVFLGQRL